MSSPESRPVCRRISTKVSVGLWEVPMDIEAMAVSITSTPASAAFTRVATDIPVVAWVCNSTGKSTLFLMAETRSYAPYGVSNPDISLMQIESAPKRAYSFANSTYFSAV